MIRFVVQSPFQALSAVEARAALHLDPSTCELIVITPNEPLGQRQLERVLRASDWNERTDVAPDTGGPSQALRVRAIRKLAKARGIDAVAIGEYRSPFMRHLANAAAGRRAEVVLLDDGVGTLLAADLRAGKAVDAPNYSAGGMRRAIDAVVPLDQDDPKHVRFVTYYDLEPGPADTVVRHTFGWTRARLAGRIADRTPLFVGTSLVESGALDADWYEDHVVRACAGGRVYVPHRRESEEKLERFTKQGVSVRPLPGPIEFELAETGWRPDSVATIFSTVLHTLPLVLEVPIRAVTPPASAVTPEWTARLASLFDTLPRHAPSVVVA